MAKTLYVSDLDGTLLDSSQRVSPFSEKIINEFIKEGGLFTFATARSLVSASVITNGLELTIPVITNNGVRIMDPVTGEILFCESFEKDEFYFVLSFLRERDVSPIAYYSLDGKDRFSFVYSLVSDEMKAFLDPKREDFRCTPVKSESELYSGKPYYFVCIGKDEKIKSIYNELKEVKGICNCVTYIDIYSGHRWLEIMPKGASKANAAVKLKEHLGATRLAVFGDGGNDISMFEVADSSYAVANADERLKHIATEIIHSNNEDGVAKWLSLNAVKRDT